MREDRFLKPIVETVAKRAGNICSNPDCQAITSGPSAERARSVSVGEAAHIFGANAGSARFNPGMSAAERADVTNAIWLCRICHKLADADPLRFSAALLFEWRRMHEKAVTARLGKPGDQARERVLARELAQFAECSDLAQRIVSDKPLGWEYKLAAELLRTKMKPILSRWHSLSRGLYTKPLTRIAQGDYPQWHLSKMTELSGVVGAFGELINTEFEAAWGPPGVPGSDAEILRVCDLYSEGCQRLLDWEESVRFAMAPRFFEEVRAHFVGLGGTILEKVSVLPSDLAKMFENGDPIEGVYHTLIKIDFPEGWTDKMVQLMEEATNNYVEANG
jgi:hypothetical protein